MLAGRARARTLLCMTTNVGGATETRTRLLRNVRRSRCVMLLRSENSNHRTKQTNKIAAVVGVTHSATVCGSARARRRGAHLPFNLYTRDDAVAVRSTS